MRHATVLLIVSSALVSAQAPPLLAPDVKAQFYNEYSQPVEPFRIVGTIHYVGAANIASYLIATPEGLILLDTGTTKMGPAILKNIEKLGFNPRNVRVLLSSHAHFDHVEGHAAMKRATGAQVMAVGDDAVALSTGTDNSALGESGWEAVPVDRVLKDSDTVTLGGVTMRALWTPGHTKGCTTWTTTTQERNQTYSVVFYGCSGPNAGVRFIGNTRHPSIADDLARSYRTLKALKPDIYLTGHPQSLFAGKVERIKAGETPHPLKNPDGYAKMVADAEASFLKNLEKERLETVR